MFHEAAHDQQSDRPVVEVRDLTCGYEGSIVLRNVDFRVMQEDFIALLGPSGSGKTTLLRSILGAVDVYGGDVLIDGHRVRDRRPRVGYVPQLESIDWNFPVTVEEVVLMGRTSGGGLMPWHRSVDRDVAYETMAHLGIDNLGRRHIRELSGGQQQRVAIARVLVQDPEVILADEPVSSVDPSLATAIVKLLVEISQATSKTLLMNLHSVDLALSYFSRIIGVKKGCILFDFSADMITDSLLQDLYSGHLPDSEPKKEPDDASCPVVYH